MESLIAIQKELKAPKGQYNSFGKYKYRSCEDILEAVKPLLSKYKCTLVIMDDLLQVGNRIYVKAIATITDNDGNHATSTAFAREPETKKGMDESQITGTASSYARKYALNGLFLIDDTKDADTDEYKRQNESKQNTQTKQTDDTETAASKTIDAVKVKSLLESIQKTKFTVSSVLKKYEKTQLDQLTLAEYIDAMNILEKYKEKQK